MDNKDFIIKLINGNELGLRFNYEFIARVCELANASLQDITIELLGKYTKDGDVEVVRGGVLDDLRARAYVLSAAHAAHCNYYKKDRLFEDTDVFEVMEDIPNGLVNMDIWMGVYKKLIQCLVGDIMIPADSEPTKPKAKKAARKKH